MPLGPLGHVVFQHRVHALLGRQRVDEGLGGGGHFRAAGCELGSGEAGDGDGDNRDNEQGSIQSVGFHDSVIR